MTTDLKIPIADDEIRKLKVGDSVTLSGLMITGRDAAHKWIADNFLHPTKAVSKEDQSVYDAIKPILNGGLIYHCGPVVAGLDTKQYRFVAAGPTTSIREEIYQGDVMRHFNMKGVIGKGGMGAKTLKACQEIPAVYFHAIGGAASLIAESVVKVVGVYKYEFGVPEAMWVIEVKNFPAVVTMDSHGKSLHDLVRTESKKVYDRLIAS
jgi:tartrate/fumarate subfamily iron-sulfur-dependent hydro-lyase beta chain